MDTKPLRQLFIGLRKRPMPESVARQLSDVVELAQDNELQDQLAKTAKARPRRSSMWESWFEPVALDRQLAMAPVLFSDWLDRNPNDPVICDPSEKDPARLEAFSAFLCRSIHKAPGRNSFKYDRLDRNARASAGLELSNHGYNKRFRFLARLEAHLKIYKKELRFLRYREVGKAGLLDQLTYADFSADPWTAAFIAYYSARRKRRNLFTNTAQVRAYDGLSDLLFEKCRRSTNSNWFALAHVFPEAEVVEQLTEEQKGALIGQWLILLRDLAEELQALWSKSDINLETMIVKRGDDSSSWNIAAQAWNTARTSWMAFMTAMGQEEILAYFCPGKVLRLMAADVAAWHRLSGGSVHPDTLVWRELPFPWQVLRGQEICTRSMIEGTCRRAGLDPAKSGWVEARVSRQVEAFTPTPELVHGVTVASPELAEVLRRLGAFSGK